MNVSRYCPWHRLGIALASAFAALPALALPSYNFTDISGLAGYQSSVAYAINDLGAIVGTSSQRGSDGSLVGRASWVWSPSSSALTAILPAPGFALNDAIDINNAGSVVGQNYNLQTNHNPYGNSAFTWSPSQRMRILATPADANYAGAYSINDSGHMVGSSSSASPGYQPTAILWDAAGHPTYLPPTPNGPNTDPARINNHDQVLLDGYDNGNDRSYLWDAKNGYTALANPNGYSFNIGTDLNDAGRAVGYALNDVNDISSAHAFLWSDPSHPIDLGVLSGKNNSLANAVNEAGTVVGTSGDNIFTGDSPNSRSFIWTAATGMVDLQTLIDPNNPLLGHISQLAAYDINDSGQIVGRYMEDGVQHAFLMTPVPEPTTWALMSMGMLALTARRLGRRAPEHNRA